MSLTAWKGHLRVSLISIPVRLVSALAGPRQAEPLPLFHSGCGQPLARQYLCPVHGAVALSAAEANPPTQEGQVLSVAGFVRPGEVPTEYRERPFHMLPEDAQAAGPYRVLAQALQSAGRAGLARLPLEGRQRMALVMPRDQGLELVTLREPRELRPTAALYRGLPEAGLDPAELELAGALVDALTISFDAQAPQTPPPSPGAPTVDLLAALEASLETTRGRKKPPVGSVRRRPKTSRRHDRG